MPSLAAGPDADALAAVAKYNLGEIYALEPLPAGSSAARRVSAAAGTFVLKPAYRTADVALQAEVARVLNPRGLRQAAVIPTAAGGLVTRSGWVLLEFLPGTAPERPSPGQITAAMRHIAAFHLALREVPATYQPDADSLWVRVASPEYLVTGLPRLLSRNGLATDETAAAIAYLDRSRTALSALPHQLVHGDIGPDNVLMDDDAVVALIDFTPYSESVLFAASTALYWYLVYAASDVSAAALRSAFAEMGTVRPWSQEERDLWPAALTREALRRLATPLALAERDGTEPGPSAGARLTALQAIIRLLPHISSGRTSAPAPTAACD